VNAVQPFCLSARGDRVRGRWVVGPPGPAAVLAAPDGCASHRWIDDRFEAWSSAATLVAFDLPLCGTRTSEKLSEHGLEAGHPLAVAIRPDLEIQLAADLGVIRALVGAAGSIAFVGCGPHEAWFRAACALAGGFDPVLVAAAPDAAWHDEVLRRIQKP
jgi:ethanolamine utilization microcompartment shell protein EutL